MQEHLEDRHLHVVAPPGSGKTVLGLEVALRINEATLILCPSLAIRNQWIDRFCELFLQSQNTPDWISTDLGKPGFLTVSTYQGLHAVCKSDLVAHQDPVKLLKQAGVQCIVLDEAHHLQAAWWKSIMQVKKVLDPWLVSLTATPPYDLRAREWERYAELTGPVDIEIAVPALVLEGDLCPHQDYIYLSRPTDEEAKKIGAFRMRREEIYELLLSDEKLLQACKTHPCFAEPEQDLEWIYGNIDQYAALIIFLNQRGQKVSEVHLDIMGDRKLKIPASNTMVMETLVSFFLFSEDKHFEKFEDHQSELSRILKAQGVLEKRKLELTESREAYKTLSSSLSKLRSVEEIISLEHASMGSRLRLVVLTDYIRKESLAKTIENTLPLNKIGVLPIFEQLRRAEFPELRIGVLTGSIVIIPNSALDALKSQLSNKRQQAIRSTNLAYDASYLQVDTGSSESGVLVTAVTKIFQQGHIEVLIGTKALLGEGWDAPAINSLILATFVGSFVLSNQMRGRAIRSVRDLPNKTGNIWHLACIDPSASDGGPDLALIKRRLQTFVGVSTSAPLRITNGMDRLGLNQRIQGETEMQKANERTRSLASARESLYQNWTTALDEGIQFCESVQIPYTAKKDYKSQKQLLYDGTLRNMAIGLGIGMFDFMMSYFSQLAKLTKTNSALVKVVAIALAATALRFSAKAINTFRLYLKHRDIAEEFEKVAHVVLDTLCEIDVIQSPRNQLKITCERSFNGTISCYLQGCSKYEEAAFLGAIQELLAPIQNPRYLIWRKTNVMDLISQNDFYAVPSLVGRKKKFAEIYASKWSQKLGKCQLIFTRNIEGRKHLLHARMNALSAQFDTRTARTKAWT